jgi:hypothetical protein
MWTRTEMYACFSFQIIFRRLFEWLLRCCDTCKFNRNEHIVHHYSFDVSFILGINRSA